MAGEFAPSARAAASIIASVIRRAPDVTGPSLSKNPSASLLPPLTDIRRVAAGIAVAVGIEAQKEGVAPKISEDELRRQVLKTHWIPAYQSSSE
jgi:malate dehydrogenase (oxaloacetate-decarboxylating)